MLIDGTEMAIGAAFSIGGGDRVGAAMFIFKLGWPRVGVPNASSLPTLIYGDVNEDSTCVVGGYRPCSPPVGY